MRNFALPVLVVIGEGRPRPERDRFGPDLNRNYRRHLGCVARSPGIRPHRVPHVVGRTRGSSLAPKFEFIERPIITGLLERLRTEGEYVDDPVVQSGVTADPDGDYLVGLALHSGADYLVSGDSDLADLDLPDLEIMAPARFLARIELK